MNKRISLYISLIFTCFVFVTTYGQSISGFKQGDNVLRRFLEKNYDGNFDKSTKSFSYHCSVIIYFNSIGGMDSIGTISNGNLKRDIYFIELIKKTVGMWDTTVVKNAIVIIPFTVIRSDFEGDVDNKEIVKAIFPLNTFYRKYGTYKAIFVNEIVLVSWPERRRIE